MISMLLAPLVRPPKTKARVFPCSSRFVLGLSDKSHPPCFFYLRHPQLYNRYKTCWEIRQKRILELAADRGAYIDQSQSLNIHMQNCSIQKLTSMHFYGWKLGLKTGQYYLRTKAAVEAIQFTVEKGAAAGQQETTTTSTPGSGGGAAIDATLLQAATAKIAAEQEQKSKYECVGCGS